MNRLKKIFIFFFLVVNLWSCAKDQKKISDLKDTDLESQMIQLYNEGYEEYLEGDTLYAAQKFNEAELIFPQSDWAPKAALMSAYVYYADDYYSDAIYELERFLKVYKVHKDIDYAHFLLAMCYYENIVDEKRDLRPLLKSRKEFEFIIKNYPSTDFAADAQFKIDLINDRLAGKEMYIARHYLKSKKWIPAINRFKNVLENYETTVYVEEALHRLVETYYIIGLDFEANKYASLLGYNYQSSEWYKATYKVFNRDYEYDEKKIKNLKKQDKKSIFKKFSSKFRKLFE
jgi:outer membrane protein assembly factor BamD